MKIALGDLFQFIRNGISVKQDSQATGLPISRIETISKSIVNPNKVGYANLDGPNYDNWLLQNDDILFSHINSIQHLGKCAIYEGSPKKLIHGMNLLCFRADKTVVDSRYILHYFRSKVFRPKLEKFIKPAVNQASVSIKDIKSIEIELPPLEEQRRIAEVLDKADALRQKRRLALQKLDTLLQSVFLEMFGDPSSVQNRLISRPFGELILNENSKRIPVKSSDRDDMSGEYPYYGASGVIDYVDDYLFDGSRLLIGEDGANLLARSTPIAFIAHGKYWVNNHAHVLASNGSANLRFLEYVFSRIDLTPYITGSAQPKLNRANLDRIPIPSPPIELQDRFEHFYEKVEQIRRASRVARDNGDNFFRAMQQRAFKGELFKGSMPSVGFEP